MIAKNEAMASENEMLKQTMKWDKHQLKLIQPIKAFLGEILDS